MMIIVIKIYHFSHHYYGVLLIIMKLICQMLDYKIPAHEFKGIAVTKMNVVTVHHSTVTTLEMTITNIYFIT